MANELNNPDKLIERILADAREAADGIRAAAETDEARIDQLADNDVWEIESEAQLQAKRLREDVLERSRTNAELDSRKYALSARRQVVDKAFDEAYRRLCALSGAERDKLLTLLAVRECDGGETLLPAQADEDAFKRLLSAINEELKAVGKAAITLGAAEPSLDGGFILHAAGYEKNCSFSAALREVREYDQSRVAALLFT